MKTVVVTGANRGIGLELCKQLSGKGHTVVAVCRSHDDALIKTGAEIADGIDVSRDQGLKKLAAFMGNRNVDWLINNAGILESDALDNLSADSMVRQFEVNSVAPLRVTQGLLPCLHAGAKVGIVTSRMGSIEDNTSGGYYGYRMSKAAVNIAGVSLARDVADRGIAVALLHPGMVATAMTGGRGVPVAQSAAGLIARMEQLDMQTSGMFFHAEGERLPW